MTAEELEDAALVGRIKGLADRLEARGRNGRDGDLTEAAGLLRLMAKAYECGRPTEEGQGDWKAWDEERGALH